MSVPRQQDMQSLVERLRIYAHAQRLLILSVLLDAERSVGELETSAGIGQPALSQQLAELRRAGIVETRRDGKHIFYRLGENEADRVQKLLSLLDTEAPAVKLRRSASRPTNHPHAADRSGAVFPRILSSNGA